MADPVNVDRQVVLFEKFDTIKVFEAWNYNKAVYRFSDM